MSNEFCMPTTQTGVGDYKNPVCKDQAPSIRLSLGPKNWPDYQPVTTIQEHFWMLQKSLAGVPMLDRSDFCNNTFISVFDLRRTPGDASSAYNSRSGDLLRIDRKNLTPDYATEVHVTLGGLFSLLHKGRWLSNFGLRILKSERFLCLKRDSL